MKRVIRFTILALLLLLMYSAPILYLVALNISVTPYQDPLIEQEAAPCDEAKPSSPWDDPEYWKNPWLL